MIKFENTEVMNFEGAFRGMRNPLNSWELSDSIACPNAIGYSECKALNLKCPKNDDNCDEWIYCIGKNDLALAQRLIKAGSDHRKFLRQIFVSVDITAPLYWWKEFDTYKVATVANSCSTMHKIADKDFAIEDFSYEHLCTFALDSLQRTIATLNDFRYMYVNWDEEDTAVLEYFSNDKNNVWWQMIQLLPSSYNQKRTITLNYETLRNIYSARRNHKLDEWSVGFMKWIDELPYAEELIKYQGAEIMCNT